MLLQTPDWIIIISYLALSLGVGLYFARRAGKSVEDFFLTGRRLTWWLAGTSIAAIAFASDTPIAVTEYVRQYGIAGNWFKWSFSLTGLSAVYLFSVYWRRSRFLTDVEFVEARYEGKPAAALRGFMAFFYGVIFNCIEMGWIISGMSTVVGVTTGLGRWSTIIILLAIATAYTTKSGLWGVVTTDFLQFFVATAGSILLWWNPFPTSAIIAVTIMGFALAPIFIGKVSSPPDPPALGTGVVHGLVIGRDRPGF